MRGRCGGRCGSGGRFGRACGAGFGVEAEDGGGGPAGGVIVDRVPDDAGEAGEGGRPGEEREVVLALGLEGAGGPEEGVDIGAGEPLEDLVDGEAGKAGEGVEVGGRGAGIAEAGGDEPAVEFAERGGHELERTGGRPGFKGWSAHDRKVARKRGRCAGDCGREREVRSLDLKPWSRSIATAHRGCSSGGTCLLER